MLLLGSEADPVRMGLLRKPKTVPDDNLGIRILWNENTNSKQKGPGYLYQLGFFFVCGLLIVQEQSLFMFSISAGMYTR